MVTATGRPISDLQFNSELPAVRTIDVEDLKDALRKGIEDFRSNPSHIVMLFAIYPLVMLFAALMVGGYNVVPLIFPLLAGFALIGPVAALGSYEMSRRRENGLDVSLIHALAPLRSPSIVAIMILSITLMAVYFLWLGAAFAIYASLFGNVRPDSVLSFAVEVVTTPHGWALIVVGTAVGFLFAAAVLTLAAISFPMLLDRNVSALTAVRTSIKAVTANPWTMTIWGVIVVAVLIIGAIPVFVGLSLAMPILGHSTWHLYRKIVAKDVRSAETGF